MTTLERTATAVPKPDLGPEIQFGKPAGGWRLQLYKVVFESDTPAGKIFDIIVIAAILLSVAAVMVDSVESVARQHGRLLNIAEWMFTILFTIEYIARLLSVERPLRYATSFFGIVDLVAVLPTYLAVAFPEAQVLIDVRILRLLRCFRIFKLTAYLSEMRLLGSAMANSMRKILVFLSVVVIVVLIVGTLMYVIEGPQHGFTSIPKAVYWALSTITTVGYGDIVPRTELGRTLASIVMLIGWGILAVPTGIVTAEMTAQRFTTQSARARCSACGSAGHESDAAYCRVCGAPLSGAA
ncbi:MAG: Ion transporter [Betaproteobacteria bacterium]|jgi:voltage-gated potassium channel|nr:Ion transporter [Betaproteobacteria bacterium]MEA3157812.1 voltage-gated potassium channel [Betaproteobacteria bacterium]